MGFFNKLKTMFQTDKHENKITTEEQKQNEEVKVYEKGLSKAREGFVSKLANLTNKYRTINDEYFDELEEILIMADIGVNTVMDFIDRLRDRVAKEKISDPELLKEIIVDELFIIYVGDEVLSSKIKYCENGPTVILFVGVNGVGKTTTIAKIAWKMKQEGKKVLLVAADTFRAGAVEQLKIWADRVKVDIVTGKENSDPASVIFDGVKKAKEDKYDLLICDTAGRVQTKQNLMDELAKMNRILIKELGHEADEVLLIIDATTGQNGVLQAKAFFDAVKVSGIVLTKMDSTSKGGIILSIKDELKIPVKFVCFGEQIDDIEEFDLEKYLYGLTKGMEGDIDG